MTFQYIIHHLDKPHSWFIVLTNPHTELNTKKKLEQQGFITYVPLVSVRRCWEGCIKEEGVSKCTPSFFYAQSPDFHKLGLCYYLKILYL